MKKIYDKMNTIVNDVSKLYEGGESYFDMLDDRIKEDERLIVDTVDYIVNKYNMNVVATGKLGMKLVELKIKHKFKEKFNIVVYNGGIRKGYDAIIVGMYNDDNGSEERCGNIFIDDSFYSGKTMLGVNKAARRKGYDFDEIFVFYDGSKLKLKNVHSLYRYYN